jgi:hypothetical protein
MSPPKYRQGDRVVVLPERGNLSVRPGIYTITRVMPTSPDGIQYRAKNEMDTHERVLQEAQLQPVSGVAPLTTAEGRRETVRPTSGREQAHRKRQRRRGDHAFQTHAETEGSGHDPDLGAADGQRSAPIRRAPS